MKKKYLKTTLLGKIMENPKKFEKKRVPPR
jgi:hypothetical protein